MPRRKTAVKIKSIGAIDIHFHGAFGIDLMVARPAQLDELAFRLRANGVGAFCPTTLSVPWKDLKQSISRLGQWIQTRRTQRFPSTGAVPLGIHLEGPYIHPGACGAHPPEAIRKLRFSELDELWELSLHQLKILTVAPERLAPGELSRLCRWARARKIVLALGHSQATEEQALAALKAGFSSVTHAWNALSFHHRSPGALGAALGRSGVALELILDQVHVSPTLLRWTRELHHPRGPLCYVSDCVPAAATREGQWHSFGHLRVRLQDGACRLPGGHLAGGGQLLPHAFARWVEAEARFTGRPAQAILREQLPHLCDGPLKALSLSAATLKLPQVEWQVGASGRVQVQAV